MKKQLFCFLLAIICVGCNRTEQLPINSMYHWKTKVELSAEEEITLKALNVNRLYVKYFDIDWAPGESEATPSAKVLFSSSPSQAIVPTVFVTNRAIQKTGEAKCKELAEKTFTLIMQLHPKNAPQPQEIQIDCDWTQSTRSAYFAFLEALHTQLKPKGIQLSATIRLHQAKYPKMTGVPPIDRGMLMFYNMGDLDDPMEDNSILDIEEAQKYVSNLDQYPLELDVALPIFAWAVLIRRGKPIKLINNFRKESVENLPWMHPIRSNLFAVDSNHYWAGHYLYPTDHLRFEAIDWEDLKSAAAMLKTHLKGTPKFISLYHLDHELLQQFPLDSLKALYSSFGE